MINNVKILLVTAGIVGVVSPIFYLTVKYNGEKELNLQLNQVLNETLQEKEKLQKYTSEIEETIKEQENKLRELSDVQTIRDSLNNTQQIIEQLNRELARVNAERAALQEANVNANTRLQNTTKELMRTILDLKLAKDDIAKFNAGAVETLKKKLEELNNTSQIKEKELAALKEELGKLKQANENLSDSNKVFAKRLRELQAVNETLQAKRSVLPDKVSESEQSTVRQLQTNIRQLKNDLIQKEERIKELQDESEEYSLRAPDLKANKELLRKISQLEDELNRTKDEARKTTIQKVSPNLTALYDRAKEQIGHLSELLVKKEMEIDSAKKESLDVKEKLISLQARLSNLENELSINKADNEKVKELEREKLTLDSRLSGLQETVAKKTELVSSLQRNLEYLTAQLAKKEKEIQSVESRYAQVDTSTREEVEKQKSRYEEINLLYDSLKTQVSQFSDALNQKELELEQRRREMGALKEEVATLKSRSENLDKELVDAKERQRKTLDDLVAAVRLNTVLQERIMGIAPPKESPKPVSEQQKKADELKRKIEVILEPGR